METKHTVFLDALVADMVSVLDDNLREEFEERAGIIEFDAKLPRAHAEALSLLNLLNRHPLVLSRVSGIWAELDEKTALVLTTNPVLARQRLADLGGREIKRQHWTEAIDKSFGGVLILTVHQPPAG